MALLRSFNSPQGARSQCPMLAHAAGHDRGLRGPADENAPRNNHGAPKTALPYPPRAAAGQRQRALMAGLLALAFAGWPGWPREATAAGRPKPPQVVLVFEAADSRLSLLAPAEEAIHQSSRYRVVLLRALVPLMRQADTQNAVQQRAAALIEEGRKAVVSLDHALAKERLTETVQLLEQSFIRYYDPGPLAQAHLLLGVTALQIARPDQARVEFVAAMHLDPTLKLDAYYSPQVRQLFNEATFQLPPRPPPSTGELSRIAALANAPAILVLSVQEAGEQSLLQGALFIGKQGAYTGVESKLVPVDTPVASRLLAQQLGAQLRLRLEAEFPPPLGPAVKAIATTPPPVAPPTPSPWYLRWYTFVAVGAIVTAVVAIPLALREEHVGATIKW